MTPVDSQPGLRFNLIPVFTGLFLLAAATVQAENMILFISAFASGDKGAIHAFEFDSGNGALKPLHRTTGVQHPFFLAISRDGRFLYAIDTERFEDSEDDDVAAYAIVGRTGQLTRLNQQSARGGSSCYLDVDATGQALLVANYLTGSVAALPIHKDGSLGEAASFEQHTGRSVDPDRQTGPFAHSIVVSPDNRFALSADLGLDKIMIYQLDAAGAKLTPNPAQPFARLDPGSGPRHLTFHPNGKAVYVINELKNTVTYFGYAADSGTLAERQTISTLPDDFTGKSYCADLKITPNGRFLYGTNRGHDSIAMYRLGDDGRLELIGIEPSLGSGPQNLLLSPDGGWLFCANMPGNNLVVFRIDPNSGRLANMGKPVAIPMPSCIGALP